MFRSESLKRFKDKDLYIKMPYPKRDSRKSQPSVADLQRQINALSKAKSAPRKKYTPRSTIGKLSGHAGDYFSRYVGLGAYDAMPPGMRPRSANPPRRVTGRQVPVMQSTGNTFTVRHREYIGDISSSVAFVNTKYEINPGLSKTYPWLSALAQNFSEYKWKGLVFEFHSQSADALASTNTALGNVAIASNYNPLDADFLNKSQVNNNMWTVEGRPSESLSHFVETAPSQNPFTTFSVRTGALTGHEDLRMYDLCNIQVSTSGAQAASVIGELWVTYEIELSKPVLLSGLALAHKVAKYSGTSGTTTNYFGTSANRTLDFDSIGVTFTGDTVSIPAGNAGTYQVTYTVRGDSTAVVGPNFTPINCARVAAWLQNTSSNLHNSATTTVNYIASFFIQITDPTLVSGWTFASGTLPANPTSMDIVISHVNNDVITV